MELTNMKEQWKEEFVTLFGYGSKQEIEDFISALLEEQRKESYHQGYIDAANTEYGIYGEKMYFTKILELEKNRTKKDIIEQILKDAPKNKNLLEEVLKDPLEYYCRVGFNASNSRWRENLSKLIK